MYYRLLSARADPESRRNILYYIYLARIWRKGEIGMEPSTTTGMEAIIAAMSDCFDLVGTVIDEITSVPVLLFLLAASLLPVGISLFRRLKNAAR